MSHRSPPPKVETSNKSVRVSCVSSRCCRRCRVRRLDSREFGDGGFGAHCRRIILETYPRRSVVAVPWMPIAPVHSTNARARQVGCMAPVGTSSGARVDPRARLDALTGVAGARGGDAAMGSGFARARVSRSPRPSPLRSLPPPPVPRALPATPTWPFRVSLLRATPSRARASSPRHLPMAS